MNDFSVLHRLLHMTATRHGVLTSNIANADTPNYKARDISFKDALDGAVNGLSTTHPAHIRVGSPVLPQATLAGGEEPWKDGNDVELEREVAKMTENALLHQAGLTMLSVKIRMFKNALRRS